MYLYKEDLALNTYKGWNAVKPKQIIKYFTHWLIWSVGFTICWLFPLERGKITTHQNKKKMSTLSMDTKII